MACRISIEYYAWCTSHQTWLAMIMNYRTTDSYSVFNKLMPVSNLMTAAPVCEHYYLRLLMVH